MNWYRVPIYFALLSSIVLSFYTDNPSVYFIFLAILFIDAKEPNIRGLVVIITIVTVFFYEVDFLVYFILYSVFMPVKVISDLILNFFIIVGCFSYMLAIYYRSEISAWGCRLLGLKQFDYFPTKADVFQLTIARLALAYHIVMTAIIIKMAYDYFGATTPSSTEFELNKFNEFGEKYVLYAWYIELLRYFSITVVVNQWSKRRSGTRRPTMMNDE